MKSPFITLCAAASLFITTSAFHQSSNTKYHSVLHINPASPSHSNMSPLFLLPEQAGELVEAAARNYDDMPAQGGTVNNRSYQFSSAHQASSHNAAAQGGVSGRNAVQKNERRNMGLFFYGIFSRERRTSVLGRHSQD